MALVADYVNLQCYVEKATVSTKFYAWRTNRESYSLNFYCSISSSSPWDTSTINANGCKYKSGNKGSGSSYFCQSTVVSTESRSRYSTYGGKCYYYSTTYTADTDWTKLNNSVQEYRESF